MKNKQTSVLVAMVVCFISGFMTTAIYPGESAVAQSVPEDCSSLVTEDSIKKCQSYKQASQECDAKEGDEKNKCLEGLKTSFPEYAATVDQNNKYECKGDDCCGNVKTSIIKDGFFKGVCNDDGKDVSTSPIFAFLKGILSIMTMGVGVAAVGGIAWGALLYTTAENKPEQTKKAIGIITNVVIGLVAYGLMYALLNFLIPGGVFN